MFKRISIFVMLTLLVHGCRSSDSFKDIGKPAKDQQAETGRYFIQFKSSPVSRYKAGQKVLNRQVKPAQMRDYYRKLEDERKHFRNDFTYHIKSRDIVIFNDFRYIANTIVVETNHNIIKQLKKASYIDSIEPVNEIVEQDDGLGIVNTEAVWAMTDTNGLAVTGKNVVVAVLDSAFNLTNPAFTNPSGSSKITGSYDFKDNKPLVSTSYQDHGTSVAGIVAMVAPGANLLLYKVGNEEDILTALETILDPDNDPSTDDKLADVLNISQMLSYGDSDNILASAFDSAVAEGLVCVVAAGNEGAFGSFTIGSPAASLTSIAVGNSIHYDFKQADYIFKSSSRGPVLGNFLIKPDLCAPGHSIYAPQGSNSYIYKTGTSFSAPMVAGAAALLLQLHPDWTALQIKAALTESATCLNKADFTKSGPESVFAQGAGRLDIKKAAEIKSLILPSSLNFGVCDPDLPQCIKSTTLQISNMSNEAVTYTFEYQSYNLVEGIDIDINPQEITLAAGESKNFTFLASIMNPNVPIPENEPYAYEGWLLAESEYETLRVPFAFIYSNVLSIDFDTAPGSVIIHNSNNFKKQFGDMNGFNFGIDSLVLPLPPGTYDIMTGYSGGFRYVVIEDKVFNDNTGMTVNMDQADKEIKVIMRDKDNNKVTKEACHTIALKHKNTGINFYCENDYVNFFTSHNIYTSALSSDYVLEWSAHYIDQNNAYYFFNDSISGISNNVTSENSPSDFRSFQQKFNVSPGIDKILVADIITDGEISSKQCHQCVSFGVFEDFTPEKLDPFILAPPFTRDVYLVPLSSGDFTMKYVYSDIYSTNEPESLSNNLSLIPENRLFRTPLFSASSSSVLNIHLSPTKNNQWKHQFFTTTADEFKSLETPYYFSGMFINFIKYGYHVRLLNSIGGGTWNVFPSLSGDFSYYNNIVYEVFKDTVKIGDMQTYEFTMNGVITTDTYDLGWVPKATYKLPGSGIYTVKGEINYYLNDKSGACSFTASFNMAAADISPPYVRSLQFLCDGKMSSAFIKGQEYQIIIEAYDYGNEYFTGSSVADYDDHLAKDWELGAYKKPASVTLEYSASEGPWMPLPLQTNGNHYSAPFSWTVNGSYVNLRISLADAAGNTLVQYIKPAFRCIEPILYPDIINTNIPCGSTGISEAAHIVITFNKTMNKSSVQNAFSMTPIVEGTYIWEENDTVMQFYPDDLEKSTSYTYAIGNNAMDMEGNAMQSDFICSFSTAPEDIKPPVILSTNLPKPPELISIAANIVINFSAPMNTAETEKAFSISPYTSGKFSWKNGNRQMWFDPENNLKTNTKYTVKISTNAVCSTGEHLENQYNIIFQTD